ncbi:hypothetical protein JCM11251_007326 [Rhodosporidiobolus azoricus]
MLDCQLDANGNPKPKKDMPKILSCREHYEIQRVKAMEKTGPDNWFVRKFAVGIVVGVFGYSYYVYVVRLCIPMIRMQNDRLGGRAQGLVYLVIFHFLFVMFIWTYLMAITTSPGYAKDVRFALDSFVQKGTHVLAPSLQYVPETDPPPENAVYVTVAGTPFHEQPHSPRPHTTAEDLHDPAVERDEPQEALEMVERRRSLLAHRAEEDQIAESAPAAGALGPGWGAAFTNTEPPLPPTASPLSDPTSTGTTASAQERERCQSASSTVGASSTLAASSVTFPPRAHLLSSSPSPQDKLSASPPSSATFGTSAARRDSEQSAAPSYLHFPEPEEDYEPVKPLRVERVPQKVPILTEQYRYDAREGRLRPYRSHRCRHCAAVVLKMDHHCPWVGSCVGARNYKYFYNFLQYSSTYCLFVFLTLLIAQTLPLGTFDPPTRPYPGADGQQIAIIAVSFLFFLFTGSLFFAHTRLILRNMTTIEEISMNRMKQRERTALNSAYGFWALREKSKIRKAWNRQWGRHGKEGNLWWLGSKRANWEAVMGKDKLPWLFPIPARPTPDDGLYYPPNPRFSKEGCWRPRREWPKELR